MIISGIVSIVSSYYMLDAKIQEAMVTIYHTLEARKKINARLKNSIKPLCPVLMRGVVEEMEVNQLKAEAV